VGARGDHRCDSSTDGTASAPATDCLSYSCACTPGYTAAKAPRALGRGSYYGGQWAVTTLQLLANEAPKESAHPGAISLAGSSEVGLRPIRDRLSRHAPQRINARRVMNMKGIIGNNSLPTGA
jgi:hypothetical protein